MARDENDRPYEDGQGRSLNPELTGDVLSPRWSTDDTDEQPAIQVVGNETYILPPDKGALPADGVRDVLDDPAPRHDLLAGHSGGHDVLGTSGTSPNLGDDLLAGQHRAEGDSPYLPIDRSYEPGLDGDDLRDDRRDDFRDEYRDDSQDELSDGYRDDRRDDFADDYDDDEPKRGFLGSGWTDDSPGGDGGGEREVRRRTRKLLIAAAAVVLVGVGAGWMLTGTSSDDPCKGAQCASAGEVSSPSEEPLPEEPPAEEPEEPVEDPTESVSQEPTETRPANPPANQQRTRPSQEASERPEPTRKSEPTAKATAKPTRSQQESPNDTAQNGGLNEDTPTGKQSDSKQQPSATEAPATQQPPATTQPPAEPPREEKGLLDILFPWA